MGVTQIARRRISVPSRCCAAQDRTGLLSWADLKDVQIHHRLVDLATFRRMDNNRSGYVDFGDLLRGLYPTIPPKDVLRQVKLLGAPDGAVADSGDEEDLRWRENFSEDQQQVARAGGEGRAGSSCRAPDQAGAWRECLLRATGPPQGNGNSLWGK